MATATLPLCSFRDGSTTVGLTYDTTTLRASAVVCVTPGDGVETVWASVADTALHASWSGTVTLQTGSIAIPSGALTLTSNNGVVQLPASISIAARTLA